MLHEKQLVSLSAAELNEVRGGATSKVVPPVVKTPTSNKKKVNPIKSDTTSTLGIKLDHPGGDE